MDGCKKYSGPGKKVQTINTCLFYYEKF
jgi:hypothetical protein